MTWAATFSDKDYENGKLRVFVNFTNGTDSARRDFLCDRVDKDQDWLNKQVEYVIDELNAIEALKESIVKDSAVSAPMANLSAKLEVDTEKETFTSDLSLLRKMLLAVDLKIKDVTDPDVKDLLEKIKAGFKPEYLDLL